MGTPPPPPPPSCKSYVVDKWRSLSRSIRRHSRLYPGCSYFYELPVEGFSGQASRSPNFQMERKRREGKEGKKEGERERRRGNGVRGARKTRSVPSRVQLLGKVTRPAWGTWGRAGAGLVPRRQPGRVWEVKEKATWKGLFKDGPGGAAAEAKLHQRGKPVCECGTPQKKKKPRKG